MTTEQELRGKWNSIVGAVKQRFGEITDDELTQWEGDRDHLIGLIQQKAGQTREQAESFVDEVLNDGERSFGTLASRVEDEASRLKENIASGYSQVAERARSGYQETAQTLARHPVESVFTSFGIGLVLGLALGISFASQPQPEPTWRDRLRR